VGDRGRLLTSTNSSDWVVQNPGINYSFTAVTWGPQGFAVSGPLGPLTSIDGMNWHQLTPSGPPGYWGGTAGAVWGKGWYVLGGYDRGCLSSKDATNWIITYREHVFDTVRGMTFGSGSFAMLCLSGAIFKSSDAQTWTQANSGFDSSMFSIAYGNGSFVAVGDSAAIFQSGPTFSVSSAGDGPTGSRQIQLTGEAGKTYWIQASDDLSGWADLCLVTNATESTTFSVPASAAVPNQFYRARLPN
jgi:hypothetical protein